MQTHETLLIRPPPSHRRRFTPHPFSRLVGGHWNGIFNPLDSTLSLFPSLFHSLTLWHGIVIVQFELIA